MGWCTVNYTLGFLQGTHSAHGGYLQTLSPYSTRARKYCTQLTIRRGEGIIGSNLWDVPDEKLKPLNVKLRGNRPNARKTFKSCKQSYLRKIMSHLLNFQTWRDCRKRTLDCYQNCSTLDKTAAVDPFQGDVGMY